MNRNTDIGLLILRLSIGILMLLHGIAKFKGVTGIENMLSNQGFPTFLAYGVYVTEIIAPLLIIIGLRTRIASFIFAHGAIVAIYLAHSKDVFTLNQFGGWGIELLGLYLFGSLALIFTGGGKIAVSSKNKWD